jgi:hypothetical protein
MLPANQATLVLNFANTSDSQLSIGGTVQGSTKGDTNKHNNVGGSLWALEVNQFTVGDKQVSIDNAYN